VQGSSGLKVVQGPELRAVYLGFDQSSAELLDSSVKGKNPFQDVRVRRAFYQAIDMDTIAAKVLHGFGRPIGTLVAPQVEGFSADADKRLPYDPQAARRLLAEAGYPEGFELGMDCPNNRYMADANVCEAVAAMLARVGIKITLRTMPKAQYFPKLFGHKTSFWMFGWIPTTYDSMHILVNLMATRDPANNRGAFNLGGYSDPPLDSLITQAKVEFDPVKRRALVAEALKLGVENVRYIPLYQQTLLWGMKQSVVMVQLPDGVVQVKWVKVAE
jgi:peptide/nickel transport system substrate-binding protein